MQDRKHCFFNDAMILAFDANLGRMEFSERTPQHGVSKASALLLFLSLAYIERMLQRSRNSRGRPRNTPAAFIIPCRPIVASKPPVGPGWAHELKHDGYRLQIHVRDGRVRLYTMNGADWTRRYPLIVDEAWRLKGSVIIDAEVVCAGDDGVTDFDALHSRTLDHRA